MIVHANHAAHVHDCEKCAFLGTIPKETVNRRTDFDVYLCDGTLVARFGDEPSDNLWLPVETAQEVSGYNALWAEVVTLYDEYREATGEY